MLSYFLLEGLLEPIKYIYNAIYSGDDLSMAENIVVFDSETTGLSPTRNGVVALGAIDIRTGDTFYEECRIDPDTEVNQSALSVNGFNERDVRDPNKETAAELLQHFEKWCNDHNATVIAGYNVNFDINFLKSIASKHGVPWTLPTRFADAEQIYLKEVFDNPDFTDDISKYMLRTGDNVSARGVKMDNALASLGMGKEPKPHNALTGATYCAELISLLIYGKHLNSVFNAALNATMTFDQYPIEAKLKDLQVDIQKHIKDIDFTKKKSEENATERIPQR